MTTRRKRRVVPIGRVPVLLALLLALPLATLTAPTPMAAQDGTPKTASAEPGSLREMLELTPQPRAVDGRAPLQLAMFADVPAQLAAVGVAQPGGVDDEGFGAWVRATLPLALPSPARERATDPEFRETFGFELLQVDQSLAFGEPPQVRTLLRGRFDERELRAAWERSGYQPVDIDGTEVASFFAEPDIDLDSPVSRLALSAMNNAAILDDGTLAFSSSLDGMREILAVVNGDAPSLAELPEVAALLDVAPPLASALLMDGAALAGGPPVDAILGNDADLDAAATAIATQMAGQALMPPVRLALLGITPGGPLQAPLAGEETPEPAPPDQARARFVLVLLMTDVEAAEAAVPVVEERLRTGQSQASRRAFADLFPTDEQRIEAIAGEPVLLVDLGLGDETPLNIWVQMLFNRDLGFVAW